MGAAQMGVAELGPHKCGTPIRPQGTPGLHNKIPALKIFARGWVAQESINAKIFQGLGPKRRESCNGDRVYDSRTGFIISTIYVSNKQQNLGDFPIPISSICLCFK